MASERAAVLARAQYTQTLRPESSERGTRAKKGKDDVDSVRHRLIASSFDMHRVERRYGASLSTP
jgi:hypothetical protein